MTKLIAVYEIHDPYEPPEILGIFSSFDNIKKCGFKNLWIWHTDKKGNYLCRNLISGERKTVKRYDFPPSPFVERIEIDKLLSNKVEDDEE